MKAEDIKTKTPDELSKMLLDLLKTQMNMRCQRAGGQLEKTHDIRSVRRNIARVKTFLNRQSAPSAPPKPAKAKKTKSKKAA